MKHEVSVVTVKEDEYEVESLNDLIRRAIELIGGFKPEPRALIAIKPNLTTDKNPPESGITTHCAVVEALIQYLNDQTQDCRIMIIESDSDGTVASAFNRLGYTEMAGRYPNVTCVDLGKESLVKLVTPRCERIRAIEIPELLLNIDHLINVANIKRHVHERLTATWKNAWGLPSNRMARMALHPFISESLFAINTLIPSDLNLADGLIGLEGAGPLEGFPRRVNTILCSYDSLALDTAAARLIGEKACWMPELKYAMKRFRRREDDLKLVGDTLPVIPFAFIPKRAYQAYRLGLKLRRIGMYIENLGNLAMIVGFALRTGDPGDYMGGGTQSLGSSMEMARDFFLRHEVGHKCYG